MGKSATTFVTEFDQTSGGWHERPGNHRASQHVYGYKRRPRGDSHFLGTTPGPQYDRPDSELPYIILEHEDVGMIGAFVVEAA